MAIRIVLVLSLLFAGCDKSPAPVAALPTHPVAQIKLLAQLTPNRTVHAAVDELSNVYYVVETENGQDGAIVVSESGLPRATQLTSANILAAMGETVGGNGNIQDLVASADGGIFFVFIGGKGRVVRACIGRFFLRNESIQILFSSDQIMKLSGMGNSIDLARATLLPAGSRMYVLLRHSDAWAMLRFAARRTAPGIDSKLERAFEKVLYEGDGIDLSRRNYDLAPGAEENLLLMDRATGLLWQIDREGHATHRAFLTGLPQEISNPLIVKQSQILFFAADSLPIEADVDDQVLRRRLPRTSYPALIQIDGKEFTAIGRDDLRPPSGFPVYSIRIHELVKSPDESFIGYDQSSGQLMRIKFALEH